MHRIASAQERAYLIDLLMLSAFDSSIQLSVRSVLVGEGIGCVGVLLDDTPELCEAVDGWLCEVLAAVNWRGRAGANLTAQGMCFVRPSCISHVVYVSETAYQWVAMEVDVDPPDVISQNAAGSPSLRPRWS
jgi:hypothetical protein